MHETSNKENVFYENIVQLGTRYDTPVVDADGNLTQEAREAVDLLDEYARTFQERNPNLYLFNCVLHLDESTPHLHIDYIPVANGYKKGMKTRNSISKALQQMGFDKGKGRYNNEVIDWEKREREYLTGLCRERGIEVEVKGDKRDNLTLPEYKAAMRKVESLEAEAEKLAQQNGTLEQDNEHLQKQASVVYRQMEEMERKKKELIEQGGRLADMSKELETGITEKMQEYQRIDSSLTRLKSKKKEIERNVHAYEEQPEWQLAEAPVLMSAREYRTKAALPMVQKLKKRIVDLTIRCIEAMEDAKKYKSKNEDLWSRVKFLEDRIQSQQSDISVLKEKERTLEDVRKYFGDERIKEIGEAADQRRKVEQIPKRHKSRGIGI